VYDDLLQASASAGPGYADVLRSGAVEGTAAELARHAFAANDVLNGR